MAKLKKVYDEKFKAGTHSDDNVNEAMRMLYQFSEKPKDENGYEDDFSYDSVFPKGFRIVLYIEE